MPQPSQALDKPGEAAATRTRSASRAASAHQRLDHHLSANRSAAIQIGGWIANLFSWYRY